MRRVLITLLLAVVALVPAAKAQSEWSSVIERVMKSIVYIEAEDKACTGFVIDTERKYVMTAAHCTGKDIWLDRVAGKLISKDTKKDLAVYEVKDLDPTRPALKLSSKDPEMGQEVISAGYGYALERPFFRKAMISDTAMQPDAGVGGPYVALDAPFVGGQSGGPVVNEACEVVMVVQLGTASVGMGVSASIIRERMGRFWGK